MVLEAVQLRGHHVAALVLGHLHLPLPGGRRAGRVDVDGDDVAGTGDRDEHMLASVEATDGRGAVSSGGSGALGRGVKHKPRSII